MKVLHVAYNSAPDTTGGAIRTRYLVEAQARLGVEVVVLSSPFQPPVNPARAQSVECIGGIRHYRCYNGTAPGEFMARKPWWRRAAKLAVLVWFARRVRQIAREEQVDLIHAHSVFFCGLAGILAGRALGLPVVYEARSLIEEGMDGAGRWMRWIYRQLDTLTCRVATHVVTICDGLRCELVQRGIPGDSITVVPNGVDPDAHQPADRPARGATIGYIGTLASYEGLDLLIEAAAQIKPRRPGLRVVLVGDGPARAALEAQVRERGLTEAVHFAGRVPHDEIERWYREVDLFALPRPATRLTDAVTPLKPLEIMAHGKALLASDCGGHRELVIDGVNGALSRAGSADELARRIEALLDAPAELERLGRQAREWVVQHRTWDSQCRPVLEIYEELVARGRPDVLLVAPMPGESPTGGVETGVAMMLRSGVLGRRLRVFSRRRPGPRQGLLVRLAGQLVHFARFAATLAMERPGVVHVKSSSAINFVESAFYSLIARAVGRRVLLQIHTGEFPAWYHSRSAVGRWAIRRALRLPHELLALAEYWKDILHSLAPGRSVRIVPNGVEPPAGFERRRPPGGELRVLTMATVSRQKGHLDILAAADRLRDRPFHFILAGPADPDDRNPSARSIAGIRSLWSRLGFGIPSRDRRERVMHRSARCGPITADDEIRRRAAELRLLDSVEFVGPVSPQRKWELLASADVFLLPSYAEAMPNAVLEAMAAGLPVIATRVGALPEMLGEGAGACLVDPGDPDAIAGALIELLESPERRERMGRWNRAQAESTYSFRRVERLLDGIYAENARPAPRAWKLVPWRSLAVFLVAGEIAARLVVPAPPQWRWPQTRFVAAPVVGFRLAPSQNSFTADESFRTNRLGLRGGEVSRARPAGVRRVLVLGDSIASGYGVAEDQSFARRLSGLLDPPSRFEVINAGIPSYNTAQEVDYFADRGLALDPDVVVLTLYWNDIHDKAGIAVDAEGRLIESGAPPPSGWMVSRTGYEFRNLLKRSRLLYLILDRWRTLAMRRHPPLQLATQRAVLEGRDDARVHAGWQAVEQSLARLATLCRSRGIRVLVLIVPMPQQLDGRFPNTAYQSVARGICERQGLPWLDLLPAFERAYRGHASLFLPYDGDHPNARGHDLIAAELYGALCARGYL